MTQNKIPTSVRRQERRQRQIERETLEERLQRKKKEKVAKERYTASLTEEQIEARRQRDRYRYALKKASESPAEKEVRLQRRRENDFMRKLLGKGSGNKKTLEQNEEGYIVGKLVSTSTEESVHSDQSQQQNLSNSQGEEKHCDNFVKQELDDITLFQSNSVDSTEENAEKELRGITEHYENVEHCSENGSIWRPRSNIQQLDIDNVNQINVCYTFVKQELDDYGFLPPYSSDQLTHNNNILKQEMDDSFSPPNTIGQVKDSDNFIKRELDDYSLFPPSDVDSLDDDSRNKGNNIIKDHKCIFEFSNENVYIRPRDNMLETSRETYCVKNESHEYGNVDDHLYPENMKLGHFECISCDFNIKTEQTFPESVTTKQVPTENTHDIHLENEKYPCELCNASFESQQSVNKHITAIHVKKKENICNLCKASFTTNHYLKIHMDNIHIKKQKYNYKQLPSNIKVVNPRRKIYPCEFCNASFESQQSVSRHITAIHVKKKANICNFCKAIFKTDRYLKMHIDNFHIKTKQLTNNIQQASNHDLKDEVVAVIPVDQSNKSPWRFNP